MIEIAKRIQETEQKFNTKQAERDQHIAKAEECLTEMTKLQGEWRVLKELDELEPEVKVKNEKKG